MTQLESTQLKQNSPSLLGAPDLLGLLPQQRPFRFIDEILEIDDKHVVASYRFRPDEPFYAGHFPDRPVTPGVILLEAMAQCGIVIHSLYLLARTLGRQEAVRYRMLITGAEVEWLEPIFPDNLVVIRSDLLAWRSHRIRVQVQTHDSQKTLVARSTISGLNVLWDHSPVAETEKKSREPLRDASRAEASISS